MQMKINQPETIDCPAILKEDDKLVGLLLRI